MSCNQAYVVPSYVTDEIPETLITMMVECILVMSFLTM